MFQLDRRNKTVHWKTTSLWGGKKVELRETQPAVTPSGGLVVFFEFLRRIGYCEAVRQHLPFSLTSPNAIKLPQQRGNLAASLSLASTTKAKTCSRHGARFENEPVEMDFFPVFAVVSKCGCRPYEYRDSSRNPRLHSAIHLVRSLVLGALIEM